MKKIFTFLLLVGFFFSVNNLFAQTYTYSATPTSSYHPTCTSANCLIIRQNDYFILLLK